MWNYKFSYFLLEFLLSFESQIKILSRASRILHMPSCKFLVISLFGSSLYLDFLLCNRVSYPEFRCVSNVVKDKITKGNRRRIFYCFRKCLYQMSVLFKKNQKMINKTKKLKLSQYYFKPKLLNPYVCSS